MPIHIVSAIEELMSNSKDLHTLLITSNRTFTNVISKSIDRVMNMSKINILLYYSYIMTNPKIFLYIFIFNFCIWIFHITILQWRHNILFDPAISSKVQFILPVHSLITIAAPSLFLLKIQLLWPNAFSTMVFIFFAISNHI